MTRLRIGIVVPGFSANAGDWCIPVQLDLARRLSCDADVTVFPLRYPHHRQAYTIESIQVRPQGGGLAAGTARLDLLRRAIAVVVAEHRRRRFDVLHAMWADEPGFVAIAAGRLLGVPVVASLLGGELVALRDIGYGAQISRVNRALIGATLRAADKVTAGSSYLRSLAARIVPQHRLVALTLGVNTEMFRACRTDTPGVDLAGATKLLHVGSLVPVKDQATLLRAVARVRRDIPGIHLHIVGDGPMRAALGTMVIELGLQGCVTFHGAVRHEALPAWYHAADLCVLSSRHEGQELVTLEAAACGRATVGTAVGILPDVMPGRYVAPPQDSERLASAIRLALDDRESCRRQAAFDTVRTRYSLEQTVADLSALYAGRALNRALEAQSPAPKANRQNRQDKRHADNARREPRDRGAVCAVGRDEPGTQSHQHNDAHAIGEGQQTGLVDGESQQKKGQREDVEDDDAQQETKSAGGG
ncbi:MAG: glycosyltransferase [Anaerolineae bacterium]